MNEPIDLSPIAKRLDQRRDWMTLHIVDRLGQAPRTLPGRARLTLEAWLLPVAAAATVICILAGLVAALRPDETRITSVSDLISAAAEGERPRAADIYMVLGRGDQ